MMDGPLKVKSLNVTLYCGPYVRISEETSELKNALGLD
jgi:hypothetical protein